MRALELFAGTHSISRALEEKGWIVDSLDVEPCFNPTFLTKMEDFDFRSIPPGTYQYIHASPPCTEFSRAKTTGPPRDFETADGLVERTLECITHLEPIFWTLENPGTGLLKTRAYMADVPVVCSLDYCCYGTMYKKPTMLWGKMPESFKGKQCCPQTCPAMNGRRHMATAQRAEFPRHVLYAIPPSLCSEIASCVTEALENSVG
jgi:hypothetical protein